MDEMQEMASRLQETLGAMSFMIYAFVNSANDYVGVTDEPLQSTIPTDYHSITFDAWLDLFLQYALAVAGQNEAEEAYDTLGAAADASIWYHSKDSTRLIHVCWFSE